MGSFAGGLRGQSDDEIARVDNSYHSDVAHDDTENPEVRVVEIEDEDFVEE